MNTPQCNWYDSIKWQVDFFQRSANRKRRDREFEWEWFIARRNWKEKMYPYVGPLIRLYRGEPTGPFTQHWFDKNFELLWTSRQFLQDDLSKLLFDCHLLLKMVGYGKYYFPRTDFEDFLNVQKKESFISDLPADYIGLPLSLYTIRTNLRHVPQEFRVISTKFQIDSLNNYRQYLIKRGSVDFVPSFGDVVFDCGACIGDISTIFASFVGASGEVHLFDPVPLHNRYCRKQVELNSGLGGTFHFNNLAVSNISKKFLGSKNDVAAVSPSGFSVDDYESTSLDDYASKYNPQKVNYIKMDIEGFEIPALIGATRLIREFKPRLAISAYHKEDDLWKIPELILKLNPEYKLYFGHHCPNGWESVYYAA